MSKEEIDGLHADRVIDHLEAIFEQHADHEQAVLDGMAVWFMIHDMPDVADRIDDQRNLAIFVAS